MVKIKAVKYNSNNKIRKNNEYDRGEIITFIIKLVINATVLLMASRIFNGLDIKNFYYAFLGAFIINILNATLKPILIFLTLPITIISMGILYPIVNVIILKLTALLLGSSFDISGIFVPLFISLFISFMNIALEKLVLGSDR